MRITYSEQPRQILFADGFANGTDYTPEYMSGILYKNEIICAHCGIVFDILEHYKDMAKNFPEIPEDKIILIYGDWVNLDEEVKGSDCDCVNPEDFIYDYELKGVHYER